MATNDSTDVEADGDAVDFRERSSISAHKYPTKKRLLAEKSVEDDSFEETILRLLDELEELRAEAEELRALRDRVEQARDVHDDEPVAGLDFDRLLDPETGE